jgi:pimeloyl-ACP methyl ester carboxylesterase
MDRFNSDGVEIAFDVVGQGPPILLIHGFASNAAVNWRDTGWVKTLVDAGRQVVLLDNRGHGQSAKLYDPESYSAAIMAEDATRLLAHLAISQADVMGYSMGARIAAFLTIAHPGLVRRAVFAGLASRMVTGVGGGVTIAAGLEAPRLADVTDPMARAFRVFAEQTKSDLKALAACMRSSRAKISVEALAGIVAPVLVVAGDKDDVAGDVQGLVTLIPNATGLVLEGRNHMNAVGDKIFKNNVLKFIKINS